MCLCCPLDNVGHQVISLEQGASEDAVFTGKRVAYRCVCVGMCVGVCVGMCVGVCVGMCVGVCVGMCVGGHMGMCVGGHVCRWACV